VFVLENFFFKEGTAEREKEEEVRWVDQQGVMQCPLSND
jgi:hypothetical protein